MWYLEFFTGFSTASTTFEFNVYFTDSGDPMWDDAVVNLNFNVSAYQIILVSVDSSKRILGSGSASGRRMEQSNSSLALVSRLEGSEWIFLVRL